MEKPRTISRQLRFVANQIIHSYIFTPGFNEQQLLSELYLASDERKERELYAIAVADFALIFEEVGVNYPSHSESEWDPVTRREQIRVE
jgi:hypothetical protein